MFARSRRFEYSPKPNMKISPYKVSPVYGNSVYHQNTENTRPSVRRSASLSPARRPSAVSRKLSLSFRPSAPIVSDEEQEEEPFGLLRNHDQFGSPDDGYTSRTSSEEIIGQRMADDSSSIEVGMEITEEWRPSNFEATEIDGEFECFDLARLSESLQDLLETTSIPDDLLVSFRSMHSETTLIPEDYENREDLNSFLESFESILNQHMKIDTKPTMQDAATSTDFEESETEKSAKKTKWFNCKKLYQKILNVFSNK